MAYTDIDKSDDYFNTVLWTGTGTDNTAITGANFSPDFVWIKHRTNGGISHHTADSVIGAGYRLRTDTSGALGTQPDGVKSFDSDGITLGTTGSINESGNPFVGWFWRGSDSSAVSNTQGSITSTVSANTTSGFSIATWVGTGSNASVGHGLGGVDFMIIKDRDNVRNWYTWNKTFAYNDRIKLDTTDAKETSTDNMTALPDSTKINMSTSTQNNGSGINYVGYFFQEKKGFSKFGSYVANADNNGPMIYLGFKPAFVIIKRTSNTNPWILLDNKRGSYNVNQSKLYPNSTDAENTDTSNGIDFLSNGFKIRRNNTEINGASGDTFIYMAFAENPFVTSTGIPTTAR